MEKGQPATGATLLDIVNQAVDLDRRLVMCRANYRLFMYDKCEDTHLAQQMVYQESQVVRLPPHTYGFGYTDQTMEPAVQGVVYKPDRKWKVSLVVTPALLKYGDHEGENYENCKVIARRRVVC